MALVDDSKQQLPPLEENTQLPSPTQVITQTSSHEDKKNINPTHRHSNSFIQDIRLYRERSASTTHRLAQPSPSLSFRPTTAIYEGTPSVTPAVNAVVSGSLHLRYPSSFGGSEFGYGNASGIGFGMATGLSARSMLSSAASTASSVRSRIERKDTSDETVTTTAGAAAVADGYYYMSAGRKRRHSVDDISAIQHYVDTHKFSQEQILILREKLSEYEEDVKIAGILGDQLYKKNSALEEKNQTLEEEIRILQEALSTHNINLQTSEFGKQDLSAELKQVRSELNTAQQTISTLYESNTSLKEDDDKLSHEVTRLRSLNEAGNFDLETIRDENNMITQNAEANFAEFQQQMADLQDDHSTLRREYQNLRKQHQITKKQLDKKNAEIAQLDKDIRTMQRRKRSSALSLVDSTSEGTASALLPAHMHTSMMSTNQELYRDIDKQTMKITSLEKLNSHLEQHLMKNLDLLEGVITNPSDPPLDNIWSNCDRTRKFLGMGSPPPQPINQAQLDQLPDSEPGWGMEHLSHECDFDPKASFASAHMVIFAEPSLSTKHSSEMKEKMDIEFESQKSEISIDSVTLPPKAKLSLQSEKLFHSQESTKSEKKKKKKASKSKSKKKNEPPVDDQKLALITFFQTYSNPDNWQVGSKTRGTSTYVLRFGSREPLNARMAYLYAMTLYLGQIVGVNKRCITHAFLLFKSTNSQIDTLCEEFELCLHTLEHHDDEKLWRYVYSFLYNAAAYFKHIRKFVGMRTKADPQRRLTNIQSRNESMSSDTSFMRNMSMSKTTDRRDSDDIRPIHKESLSEMGERNGRRTYGTADTDIPPQFTNNIESKAKRRLKRDNLDEMKDID